MLCFAVERATPGNSCLALAGANRLRGKVPIRSEALDLRPREGLHIENGHAFERIRQVTVGTRRDQEAGIVVLLDLALDLAVTEIEDGD